MFLGYLEKCLFLKTELKFCTENRFLAYTVSLTSATGEFEYDAFEKVLMGSKKRYVRVGFQNMPADNLHFLAIQRER